MTRLALLMDLAAPLVRRLAPELRERGFDVVTAGGAVGDVPDWASVIERIPGGEAAARLDRLLADLPQVVSDPRSVQAFSCALGNPLAIAPQETIRRIVELAGLEYAALERFERFLAARRPAVLVLGCDNNHAQRATIARARQLGIPSLQIAHGIYGSLEHLSYAGNMDRVYADHVAAAGSRAREHMLKLGNESKRIHLTGSMQWDELYETANRPEAPDARAAMGLDPDRPLVLLTTGYSEGASSFYRAMSERFVAIHRAIGRAARRLPERYQIAIRPHPLELGRLPEGLREPTRRVYLDHVAELCGREVALSTGPLPRDLRAADAVASVGSSSVIAISMILGRPALNLPWFPGDDHVYDGKDGVLVVDDDDLGPALGMLAAEGPARRRALEAQQRSLPAINEGHDGRATARVADLISRLVASEKPSRSAPVVKARPAAAAPPAAAPAACCATQEFMLLGGSSDHVVRRLEDDRRALATFGEELATTTRSNPILHLHGRPAGPDDLELVRSRRRDAQRIVWSPPADGGYAVARARAVSDHLDQHGHDPERRALIHDLLAADGLQIEVPRDERDRLLVADLLDLVDLVVFSCDEELRRFLRRHRIRRSRIAVCPLGIGSNGLAVHHDSGGGVLVAGGEGARAVAEALAPLDGRLILLEDDPGPRSRLAFDGLRIERAGEIIRISALALPADTAIDSRLLWMAADGIPVIADVESPYLDYLGSGIELTRFDDLAALRSIFAARLLEPGFGNEGVRTELRELFSLDRAGRALLAAYDGLRRAGSTARRQS